MCKVGVGVVRWLMFRNLHQFFGYFVLPSFDLLHLIVYNVCHILYKSYQDILIVVVGT